jgi:hypothetical protein
MESRVEMTQHDRDVFKIMSSVLQGERTQSEAARLLHLSESQVRRIQRRLEHDGDGGVVHGLRGRASNRQLNTSLREEALLIYEKELLDFGPTLASEVLYERGLEVSSDTLRRWLLASGLRKRVRRRDQNRLYQLSKPPLPGLRQGRVIIEQRLDGTLAIRFGQRYLSYEELGALPPSPRSFLHGQHPAVREEDRAPRETRSPAVTLVDGCSGRTPAEPYPSVDTKDPTPKATIGRQPNTHSGENS